ncbi:glutamine--fructose-6-phosphate transaminase (isomerizing) [Actinotignum sanguinis]|uniref:glutamine--fructose-6-phosphate transaminase (isomerizing) n=1 Tax=Actinomycetaceae TaxID=2049 RepID=UPI00237E8040|nr:MULTISPECIES: glutamine--fructose-6-phosphate transaminase (isomerizing) [Actinotignum]MDE1655238.1 glutamine--fructose-6-phosphate transaminase (isomerizing) [Actinotignum schaalii]MDK7198250.1 glutamine--fructose-6-phosphate transaminase (isomerizing) [Actinotignum sanguinis]
MCGIVGYAGPRSRAEQGRTNGAETAGISAATEAATGVATGTTERALQVVLEGLARLEYRGYDSAGVAVAGPEGLRAVKRAGRLDNLRQALQDTPLPPAQVAIGHTRWATHGSPSDTNAHPHVSFDGRVAIVHNGIIENYRELAQALAGEGIRPVSDTDSEIAAHILAQQLAAVEQETAAASVTASTATTAEPGSGSALFRGMLATANIIDGSFTLVAIDRDHPDTVVAARRNSPLVIGLGEGENYLGSDVAAFISETQRALEVPQDTVVEISADAVRLLGFDGSPRAGKEFTVDWDASAAVKGGYATFMDKEIHEQPRAVADTLRGRVVNDSLQLDEMRISESVLRTIDKIIVIAAGTASYAGQVARYAIEHWCRIPVEVELASEFRYRDPVVGEKTLVVAISQSGETMDTIMAVRHAREQGSKVLAIVNTYGSTIARESDAVLYTHAGPEIAVASTKAFVAQITASYLLGLYLAQIRGNKFRDEITGYLDELEKMPARMEKMLAQEPQIRALARELKGENSVLFLGRHVGFPIALEGALKLKEIAYVHAEGFAAGELKHGPIALVTEDLPIFVIVPTPRRPELHAKTLSNLQEVRSRGARTIVVAEEGDDAVRDFATAVFWAPRGTPTLMMPLVTVIPLQIFASEMAAVRGYDVDKPRNLAKSVTVE